MPSEKQIEAGMRGWIDAIANAPENEGVHERRWRLVVAILTAAEQAEPLDNDVEIHRWQRATAVQSRKLQMVLDIPGVKERIQEVTGSSDGYMLAGIEQSEPLPTEYYYPIEMPLNEEGQGPASFEKGEVRRLVFEVWDQDFQCHGTFETLSGAIAHANKLNAPAARSGAVKVDDSLLNALRLSGRVSFDEFKQTVLRALEPAEPEVMCVGCEGKPSLGNSPCAVCGKQSAEPAADVEPVILSEKSFTEIMGWVDNPPKPTEKLKEIYQAYIDNKSKSKSENTRPPESRLREALEFYADSENWKQNGPLDPNSGNFTGGPARAALAQEDGR